MILAFDTETTGKANFKLLPDHPSQPRLVQIGAILVDSSREVRAEINLIVKPEGFSIPEEASRVHGITTEVADLWGLPLRTVLIVFSSLIHKANTIVAHNLDYDSIVMRGEWKRAEMGTLFTESHRPFCTMKASTEICKLPGPYGFKWPTLQEAHQHFFQKPFEGAHDAMADVRACLAIYYKLQENYEIPKTS